MNTHRSLALVTGAVSAILFLAASPSLRAQTLSWPLNDTSTPLAASDASGNSRNGETAGNVIGTGSSFKGFTNQQSCIYIDLGEKVPFGKNATLALRFKNPGVASRTLIAGLGTNDKGNRAWEIWLSAPDTAGQRTLNLTYGNWNGGITHFVSSPLEIPADTWQHLAFVWKRVKGNTYSFSIYLSSESPAFDTPVVAGTTPGEASGPGPATGSIFYVGGHAPGWYSKPKDGNPPEAAFPGGYFGDGEIADVVLWLGKTLSPEALASRK